MLVCVCVRGEIIVAVCEDSDQRLSPAEQQQQQQQAVGLSPSHLRGFQERLTGRAACDQEEQEELWMNIRGGVSSSDVDSAGFDFPPLARRTWTQEPQTDILLLPPRPRSGRRRHEELGLFVKAASRWR